MFGFDIPDLILHYGYGLVFAVIALESMGVPLPGESLLIAAALYAATTGNIAIEWVALAAVLGSIAGDNAGYLIGRRIGTRAIARYGPRVGLNEDRQKLGQFLFLRHGGKVVFFGRFVVLLRTFAAVLAGANRMNWGRFLLWNALGGTAWTALYAFVPFLLGSQVHKLTGPAGWALGGLVLAAVIGTVVFVHRNEARLITQAKAAMAERESAIANRRARGIRPARSGS